MRYYGLIILGLSLGLSTFASAGDDLMPLNSVYTARQTGPTSLFLQGADGSSIQLYRTGPGAEYFIQTDRNGHQHTGTIYSSPAYAPSMSPLDRPMLPPAWSPLRDPLADPLGLGR
jgi:hypothetical protein